MKQQAEQSISPDTSHKLRNDETAIFLVSPDAFIQISIRDGPVYKGREGGREQGEREMREREEGGRREREKGERRGREKREGAGREQRDSSSYSTHRIGYIRSASVCYVADCTSRCSAVYQWKFRVAEGSAV